MVISRKNDFMEAFFDRHYPTIQKLANRLCNRNGGYLDCHDADDIVQLVCEKIFKLGPAGLGHVDNEEGYLYRTVYNCFIDLIKQRKRETSVTVNVFSENLVELLADQASDPARGFADIHELYAAVDDILADMSSLKRTIGRMYFIDDCTQNAIARSVRRSQATVAGHVADIRRCLRDGLRKRYPEEVMEYHDGG